MGQASMCELRDEEIQIRYPGCDDGQCRSEDDHPPVIGNIHYDGQQGHHQQGNSCMTQGIHWWSMADQPYKLNWCNTTAFRPWIGAVNQ